jgi:hypothetical protein
MADESKESKMLLGKIYLSCFGIIVLISAIVFIGIRIDRYIIVESAETLARSFHIPPETEQIFFNSGFQYASPGCFHSYSTIFLASDLNTKELVGFYRNYFSSRGWNVMPREIDTIHTADGEEIPYDEYDITIPGFDDIEGYRIEVLLCGRFNDCTRVSPEFSDKETIDNYSNNHETTYWILVVFKPERTRNNLCNCCSGG